VAKKITADDLRDMEANGATVTRRRTLVKPSSDVVPRMAIPQMPQPAGNAQHHHELIRSITETADRQQQAMERVMTALREQNARDSASLSRVTEMCVERVNDAVGALSGLTESQIEGFDNDTNQLLLAVKEASLSQSSAMQALCGQLEMQQQATADAVRSATRENAQMLEKAVNHMSEHFPDAQEAVPYRFNVVRDSRGFIQYVDAVPEDDE